MTPSDCCLPLLKHRFCCSDTFVSFWFLTTGKDKTKEARTMHSLNYKITTPWRTHDCDCLNPVPNVLRGKEQHMNQLSASVRFWLDSQMSLITPDEFCSCSVGSLYSLRSFCNLPPAGYSKEYSFKLQASAGLFIPRGYIHLLCTACGKFWNIELYLGKCSIQALWKSF